MANFCENRLIAKGPNIAQFVAQAACVSQDGTKIPFSFNSFVPVADMWQRKEIWGTEVDAHDVELELEEDEAKFSFNTAWCPAEKFMLTISKQFPDYDFTLWYQEDAMGFTGESTYKNGVEVSCLYNEDRYSREYWEISGADPELEHQIGLKTWTVHLEDIHGEVLETTEVEAHTMQEAEELGDTVFKESDWSEYPAGYKACAYADRKGDDL